MKRLHTMIIALGLLAGSGLVMAAPQDDHGHGHGHGYDDDNDQGHGHGHNPKDEGRHDNGKHKGWYKKGERLPDQYYVQRYYVTDYEHYHLYRPEPGRRWVRGDDGAFYLTLVSSGVVIDIATGL